MKALFKILMALIIGEGTVHVHPGGVCGVCWDPTGLSLICIDLNAESHVIHLEVMLR
jgi:hypothetical protein